MLKKIAILFIVSCFTSLALGFNKINDHDLANVCRILSKDVIALSNRQQDSSCHSKLDNIAFSINRAATFLDDATVRAHARIMLAHAQVVFTQLELSNCEYKEEIHSQALRVDDIVRQYYDSSAKNSGHSNPSD